MIQIKQTEDKELLKEILKQLKANDNYCPCALDQNPDTKCMCKKFRDQVGRQEPGECDCGRYELVITEN